MSLPDAFVFVDLETTGARPEVDRITEIGIVEIRDGQVFSWSRLINPEADIPPFIQNLTGITPAMVADAPTFAQVAAEVLTLLQGRVFVAHNVRFDYSFLRAAFKRVGLEFHAPTLCTVKLSRKLYPDQHKHNLDSLVERHGFQISGDRHRALVDADVLRQFWQQAQASFPPDRLQSVLAALMAPPAVPPHLDTAQLDDLPDAPGVLLCLGQEGQVLYVHPAEKLRKNTLALFTSKNKTLKTLWPQVYGLRWQESAGEIGAALLEARLQQQHRPPFNARTDQDDGQRWSWRIDPEGQRVPELVPLADWQAQDHELLFGIFASAKEARTLLNKLVKVHRLCSGLLGISDEQAPCPKTAQCRGACTGKESRSFHAARLLAALAKYKLNAWPWPRAIALLEKDTWTGRQDWHVFDRWRWLGTVQDRAQLSELSRNPLPWQAMEYRILEKTLRRGGHEIILLD